MSRSPSALYQDDLAREGFAADPGQATAVAYLQTVYEALLANPAPAIAATGNGWWPLRKQAPKPVQIRGLYLWGSVGRGKTYLVDRFMDSLPTQVTARRVHFHRFMQEVHGRLKSTTDKSDPLKLVADAMAPGMRALCLDEFQVNDITDAMLLAGLLEALFERGVTLVATSNTPPNQLYADGLQRQRFLPAISLLQQRMEVLELTGSTDYRMRALKAAEVYHSPLDAEAEVKLREAFDAVCPSSVSEGGAIDVNGRSIATLRRGDGVAWFRYQDLFEGPRSTADYIELARLLQAVVVEGIPGFDASADDPARRFINAVDEFYDRGVKLFISAAVPVDGLYTGNRLASAFERTGSRLLEMQSEAYLGGMHRSF